jgi:hypothetical protein
LTERIDNPELDDNSSEELGDEPRTQLLKRRPRAAAPESDEEGRADEEEGWEEPLEDDLPPRPGNRFLRPLPLALIVLLIASLAFLGGVRIQKSNEAGGSSASPFGAGGVPSFLSEAGAGAAGGGVPSLTGSAQGSGITGTVTSVSGKTVYVKNSEGTVLAVKAGAGATVTRTANSEAKAIHPGDSVVVEGTRRGSNVTASSIGATASGVETTLAAGAEGGESGGETSVQSLFGE